MTKNPFEFDAAPNLDPKLLVEWFIEDHNFSRFIQSTRNVIINGERGSGKSMNLIYNSIRYQKLRQKLKNEKFPPDHIGIYIPCNTPLTHKQEYKLLTEIDQAIISEHFFSYSICAAIAKDLDSISNEFSEMDHRLLYDEFSYLLEVDNGSYNNLSTFKFLQRAVRDKLKKDQIQLAKGISISVDSIETGSFYTLVLPILSILKQTELLKNTHISLLIDDAHDLNSYQCKMLNSWLAYRDHTVFSFKVAIAGIRYHDMRTSFGGTILEGHDYITIDLEQPYQSKESEFGKFARDVVTKRLNQSGIFVTADDFFPENESFRAAIHEYEEIVRDEAIVKGLASKKAITDYVYKYARARYFQNRPAKANKPQYSGFETIVHLSTGVVRHLLNPCYSMFEQLQANNDSELKSVTPAIQSEVIHDLSSGLWDFVKNKLEMQVEGCGKTEADKVKNLITKLVEHFRDRLHKHKSEPRVLSFSISGYDEFYQKELDGLFRVARKAQLIYIRSGPAKSGGGREDFYTLNRMLLPAYGLDVQGQNGRASLKAIDLLNAAKNGVSIPTNFDKSDEKKQVEIFDE
jgi:hypothetical protein